MKLRWSKILTDPAFWALLAVNCWLVYAYMQTPAIFTTLLWLYWAQGMLYGAFNYIHLRTSKNLCASDYNPETQSKFTELFYAKAMVWTNTVIYAVFHIVYIVFLATMKKSGSMDWPFFWKFLGVFALFQVFSLVQYKVQDKGTPVDISKVGPLPFIRVVPMHLCILIAGFVNTNNLLVFLVLKVICDMIMYVYTTTYYRKNDLLAGNAVLNVNSNLST